MWFFLTSLLIIIYLVLKYLIIRPSGQCTSKACLVGKTALITGAGSGIGFQTAIGLASRGCRVILTDVIDLTRARQAIIKQTNNNQILVKHLDLASFKSVRNLAKDINDSEERLDILCNNAGIADVNSSLSEDGILKTLQVNYFGHFLLTHLLIGLLKKSAPSRIIITSSIHAFLANLKLEDLTSERQSCKKLWSAGAYGNSNLLNALSVVPMAGKLEESKVVVNALHPGLVRSNLFKATFLREKSLHVFVLAIISWLFGKSCELGAQTILHLACSKSSETISGQFYVDCLPFLHPKRFYGDDFVEKIWQVSEQVVKLEESEKM